MNHVTLDSVPPVMAGFVVPLWGVPLIFVAGAIGIWYRKKKDDNR